MPLMEPPLDEVAADVGLVVAAKQDAVRQNDRAFARALQRGDDVQQERVVAVFRRRDAEVEAVNSSSSVLKPLRPRLGRERRIGDDEIERLQAAVAVS